ncbi:hypothetical protein [Sorangium sp. So ce854]|uniref:hypothetical protein n=1 Tax=Sorangium sp. So ce854 TaxID=3133322 RepID=UPI003F615D76
MCQERSNRGRDNPRSFNGSREVLRALFYASRWIGSRWQDVEGQDFCFFKPQLDADGEQAIFVAPSSNGATWQEKDHALFDDIMAFMNENVCYDTTRVFATGFSFGGMITYSLSTNHQAELLGRRRRLVGGVVRDAALRKPSVLVE